MPEIVTLHAHALLYPCAEIVRYAEHRRSLRADAHAVAVAFQKSGSSAGLQQRRRGIELAARSWTVLERRKGAAHRELDDCGGPDMLPSRVVQRGGVDGFEEPRDRA